MGASDNSSRDSGGLELIENFLEHFGVKGMRWGVRKQPQSVGQNKLGKLVLEHSFSSGDKLSIYKSPPGIIPRTLSRISASYKKDVESYPQFSFRDKDGNKVGTGAFVRESKDSLYLDWIGIKPKHRGRGYATAAMKGVIKYSQDQGIKKLKLDVPGNALDAQHIYTKLGFKRNNNDDVVEDNPAASLYGMEMDVPSLKHAQITEQQWEEQFAEEFAQLLIDNFGAREEEVTQMSDVEDFLAHYGVKGMKWGKRKTDVGASQDSSASTMARAKAKGDKSGVKVLSNKELQTAINRMNLEQQFKRLSVNEKSAVNRWISSTLLEIGKREVQQQIAKGVVKAVSKAAT